MRAVMVLHAERELEMERTGRAAPRAFGGPSSPPADTELNGLLFFQHEEGLGVAT